MLETKETNQSSSQLNLVLNKLEFQQMELRNYMQLCSMMFLNFRCWHYYFKTSSANHDQDPYDKDKYDPYLTKYPYCTNKTVEIVKVIDCHQTCIFLVGTMTNTTKVYAALQLGDALLNYLNSGCLFYRCKNHQTTFKE